MGPERIEREGILAEHPQPVKPNNPPNSLMEERGGKPAGDAGNMNSCPTQEDPQKAPKSVPSRQDLTTRPALGQTCSLFVLSHTEPWCIYDHLFHQAWLKAALDPKTEGETLHRQSISRLSSSTRLRTWHAYPSGRE